MSEWTIPFAMLYSDGTGKDRPPHEVAQWYADHYRRLGWHGVADECQRAADNLRAAAHKTPSTGQGDLFHG